MPKKRVSGKTWGVDSIGVRSVIKPANLNYPDNVVAGFANDCFFKLILPQRGVMLIADPKPVFNSSRGAICFMSQFIWPTPIHNSTPIWFSP